MARWPWACLSGKVISGNGGLAVGVVEAPGPVAHADPRLAINSSGVKYFARGLIVVIDIGEETWSLERLISSDEKKRAL